jgi:hypothetical protein
MRPAPRRALRRLASASRVTSVALLLLAGCAGAPRTFRAPGPGIPVGSVVGFVPLVNLTENEAAPRLFTDKLLLELGRLRYFEVQDPGVILGYLRELRILVPDRMSREQMAKLAERSGAGYFLVGTITDCREDSETPAGTPVAGLNLRLINAASGAVMWAASIARTGTDRETFFGFGKIRNLDKLSASMAHDLVSGLRGIDRSGPPLMAWSKKETTP